MRITRVKYEDIRAAGQEALVRVHRAGGGWILSPAGRLYRNQDDNLCVHGYAAFIEALLQREPGAYVETVAQTYRGLEDFLNKRGDVARIKETLDESCTCDTDWEEA